MRLVDAEEVVKLYDNERTTNALKGDDDAFLNAIHNAHTIQAVPIEVLDKIRAEIDRADMESCISRNTEYHKGLQFALQIIGKYRKEQE